MTSPKVIRVFWSYLSLDDSIILLLSPRLKSQTKNKGNECVVPTVTAVLSTNIS